MCRVPGLSDGKYLKSREFIPEELTTGSAYVRACGARVDGDRRAGLSRRDLLASWVTALSGLALAAVLESEVTDA